MAGLQGRTLGGFQLTEQIASAGIAEVYRARPVTGNGREVVIKIIYPEFARYPGFAPNFGHIVQTAARLASHPHILPVVASGEENGYLYLATPYVADGTLRDLIARGGRLGANDTAPFFQQLCGGLAYAHSLGLVHGNLKPGNVFLYEGRHVMLGDFGMLWDIRQLDMNHSGSGTDVVEYLAPESFSGQFTQASDIYSLGAILFATLTGRPPFSATRPADLRDAHMQYPPPRLAQADPSLPPAVQALDPVIQQAMAKRPEDRFPSAMALAQAIDTILKQQPAIPAAPPMAALPAGQSGPQYRGAQPMAQPLPQAGMQPPGMQPPGMQQPGMQQPGMQPPAVPGNWAAPGPIQPAVPPARMAALPAPSSAAMRPLDPPFPLMEDAQPAGAPLAQGWPAAEPIQYTERVPAPQVARPLFSRPQLQSLNGAAAAPNAPGTAGPDPWAAAAMPGLGDDPDWKQEAWPAAPQSPNGYDDAYSRHDFPSQQNGRDGDWRYAHNAPSHAAPGGPSSANYPSEYSEYTDQRVAVQDNGYGMSRADWHDGAKSGPHSDALRYRGGFSATELGLPRLTNPALEGELPPEWEDLLAGEILPSRADIAAGGSRRPAPPRHDPPSAYGFSSASQPYPPDRPGPRQGGQRGQREQSANDGRGYGQPPAGRQGGQRGQPMPTLASAQYPAFAASRVAPQPAPKRASQRQKRRWPGVLLVLVLLLALAGGTGVVLAKPAACPGTICVQANHYLHHHLAFLGPAGNANVLAATPATLTLHAIAGSTTNLNMQISNSGTDPAVWQASASVGWLTISPSNGTLPPGGATTLSVVARPLNVTPGKYSPVVKVVTADTSISIPVAATIATGPKIALSGTTLDVTACGTAQQSFKISNAGDGPLTFTATPSSTNAVQLSSSSGSVNPGQSVTIAVTIACSANFADYTVAVSSNGGNGTVTIHYS